MPKNGIFLLFELTCRPRKVTSSYRSPVWFFICATRRLYKLVLPDPVIAQAAGVAPLASSKPEPFCSAIPAVPDFFMPATPSSFSIRPATEADAPAILAIYTPFVEATAISFEVALPTADDFAARIGKVVSGWQWLVAEQDGRCAGYAYGTAHRDRAAYRFSVEVSAYVRPDFQRRGIGSALYRQLFDDLAAKGYCRAYAGITLPNDSSIALHRTMGFSDVGTFESAGRKFGKWHDVAWFQKALRADPLRE